MVVAIVGVLLLIGWAFMTWSIIRADTKDWEAYDRWYEDPSHIWNQWKQDP